MREEIIYTPSIGTTPYPCLGGYHDYAVGEKMAVCNRCGDVVRSNPVKIIPPDRSG